jgi:hypothetical protein
MPVPGSCGTTTSAVGWAECNEAQQIEALNVGLRYRSAQPTVLGFPKADSQIPSPPWMRFFYTDSNGS